MGVAADRAVYRLRKSFRKDGKPGRYRDTFELLDERTQRVMAACDLAGRAAFSTLAIVDHEGGIWEQRPNRAILPSRWLVRDPRRRIAMQFDQQILGKLSNPLWRTALVLLDAADREVFRVVDPRTGVADRLIGVGPDDWAIVAGNELVARLGRLPRAAATGGGLPGWLRSMLAGFDPAIFSAAPEHALPAPVALGMLLIFKELTDASAG